MEQLYRDYFSIVHPTLRIDTRVFLNNLSQYPMYSVIPVLKDGKRVGFIDGYALLDTKNTFRMLNAFRGEASKLAVYRAFEEFERYILSLGYTGWYSLVSKDTQSLIQRLGAKEI